MFDLVFPVMGALGKKGEMGSVNDILKTVCDIEHTRHLSAANALVNLYAGLCSYSFFTQNAFYLFNGRHKLTLNKFLGTCQVVLNKPGAVHLSYFFEPPANKPGELHRIKDIDH